MSNQDGIIGDEYIVTQYIVFVKCFYTKYRDYFMTSFDIQKKISKAARLGQLYFASSIKSLFAV